MVNTHTSVPFERHFAVLIGRHEDRCRYRRRWFLGRGRGRWTRVYEEHEVYMRLRTAQPS